MKEVNMLKLRALFIITFIASLLVMPIQTLFAQEYNCGAYGAGGFGDGDCIVTGSEDLSDTGINVWLLRAIAAALLLLAVGVLVYALRKRRQRKQSFQAKPKDKR